MNFDRIAPHYGWLETVTAGRLLQRVRTTWLEALGECERVLAVGVGWAPLPHAFLERYPGREIVCVDASASMLAHARRRVERLGAAARHVQWVHASVPEWTPPAGRFDALATCFFLDCFPAGQLRAVVHALAAGATADAAWLVSDFAVPPHGLARWRARAIHALMYAFFRRVTRLPARRLTPPDELLATAGFVLNGRREFSAGLLRADWWQR